MATKPEIAQLLTIIRAGYPRQAITTIQYNQMVDVWSGLLADLPIAQLTAAAEHHITSSTWFPSLAEIRQGALDLVAPPSDRMSAMEAWQEVRRSFSTAPCFVTWSGPVVKQAYEAMGGDAWRRSALVDNEPADRARFLQAFEALQRRHRDDHRMLPSVREFVEDHRAALETADPDADADADLLLLPDPDQAEARRQFTALVRGMTRS